METDAEKEVILYLDDEALNCFVFERCFKKHFSVLTTRCPREALQILADRPEITKVVTDYKMPEMNGLEFVETAEQRSGGRSFFMLSGFELPEGVAEALKRGLIKAYFQKPLNRDLILSELR